MASVRDRLAAFGWRRLGMTVVIVAVLAFYLGVVQGWRNQALILTAWIGGVGLFPDAFLLVAHRVHEIGFALMFWPFIVGLVAQFRRPTRKIAAMLMAVVFLVAVLLGIGLTGRTSVLMVLAVLGIPTLIATLLHPAGRELVTSIDRSRINRVTLGLVVVAAIPLVAYAGTQVGLQTGAIEPAHAHGGHDHGAGGFTAEDIEEQHVEAGHYMNMVVFAFLVIGVGLLASLQQPGWWIPAWVVGLMTVVFGLTALAVPTAASNPGLPWAVAAILWGVAFIGTAEYTQETPSPLGGRSTSAAD